MTTTHAMKLIAMLGLSIVLTENHARAFALSQYKWPQAQLGDVVTLTYSYSNLFDGGLLDSNEQSVPVGLLRASVEEAFSLWAAVAPLHFIEVSDAGPPASDASYFGTGLPQIRIGHHPIDGFGNAKAHAYYPFQNGGEAAGDVHFDDLDRWQEIGTLTFPDVLGAAAHELGHALGLDHSADSQAVMFPIFQRRQGPGSGLLTSDDIAGIQAIYGSGIGSVSPIPEPSSAILIMAGLAFVARRRSIAGNDRPAPRPSAARRSTNCKCLLRLFS